MKEFRYVGGHADTLEKGTPVEPGQYTGLINERTPKHRQLINDGLLIEVPAGTADAHDAEDSEAVSHLTSSVRDGLGHSDNDPLAAEEAKEEQDNPNDLDDEEETP